MNSPQKQGKRREKKKEGTLFFRIRTFELCKRGRSQPAETVTAGHASSTATPAPPGCRAAGCTTRRQGQQQHRPARSTRAPAPPTWAWWTSSWRTRAWGSTPRRGRGWKTEQTGETAWPAGSGSAWGSSPHRPRSTGAACSWLLRAAVRKKKRSCQKNQTRKSRAAAGGSLTSSWQQCQGRVWSSRGTRGQSSTPGSATGFWPKVTTVCGPPTSSAACGATFEACAWVRAARRACVVSCKTTNKIQNNLTKNVSMLNQI